MTLFEYLCREAGMTEAEAKEAQKLYDQELARLAEKYRPAVRAQREAWKRVIDG